MQSVGATEQIESKQQQQQQSVQEAM